MNKISLEPGRRYKGTFWVNEYGEFQCRPEQKGTKPGNFKIVADQNDTTIYESTNFFKLVVKVPKNSDPKSVVDRTSKATLNLISYLGRNTKPKKK